MSKLNSNLAVAENTSPKDFIKNIKETIFARGGTNGLDKFIDGTAPIDIAGLYTKEEAVALQEAGVADRMRLNITSYYYERARKSQAITNLVKARVEEVNDLSGQVDPSNQNKYSPIPGLLHKYELGLIFVSKHCSSHCRYCYRLDLFSGKTDKQTAEMPAIAEYIIAQNQKVKDHKGIDPETGEKIYPITEILLSGGDPMVLPNKKLARIWSALAEAGISKIRVGTKELAFYPERFDDNFFNMLDAFHASYPHVRLNFIVHFTHPDEFLEQDENGEYIEIGGDYYQWSSIVDNAVKRLAERHFIYMCNQTPIIDSVNNDPNALHRLQREMFKHRVENHYFFQCREIEGHRAFAVPVEESYKIFNDSQKGLSGVETHAKFALSTEYGKMEFSTGNGFVILKIQRSPGDAETRGNLIIAKSNPEALWLSGYKDRIIYDETGIFLKDGGKNPFIDTE
ncbi:MAG: KamA family radical SAM protein [Alphaproteobacteria bacterium]